MPLTATARRSGWSAGSGTTRATSTTCPRTRTFPSSVEHRHRTTLDVGEPKDDYNDVDTNGARAALKLDLNDNWTITPPVMAPGAEDATARSASIRAVGDLKVSH